MSLNVGNAPPWEGMGKQKPISTASVACCTFGLLSRIFVPPGCRLN